MSERYGSNDLKTNQKGFNLFNFKPIMQITKFFSGNSSQRMDLQQISENLIQASQDAEKAVQKSIFNVQRMVNPGYESTPFLVSKTNHDLRTGITIISGFLEVLEHQYGQITQEKAINYIKIINRNLNNLKEIIEGKREDIGSKDYVNEINLASLIENDPLEGITASLEYSKPMKEQVIHQRYSNHSIRKIEEKCSM